MIWGYILVSLVVGVTIGAISMRYGNRKLRTQQILQRELDQSKIELKKYHQELESHFAYSAELLDNMARNYRQLYQHMIKSSNYLLADFPHQENLFRCQRIDTETKNDQIPIEIPRDYS